ncbi:MAG: hypothetical protein R3F11_23925 [Verrucomicrobiales bacterium]
MAFNAEEALGYLRRAHEGQRLAHAYLVTGPESADKVGFAEKFVALLRGEAPRPLADLGGRGVTQIQPESKSRVIRVEQIRTLEHSLYMTSAERWKIGVVHDADRMNPQATNAFLKTLEEPPARTVLLLLTALPERLLDTVLSRCIRVPLRAQDAGLPPHEQAAVEALGRYAQCGGHGVSSALRLVGEFSDLLRAIKEEEADRLGKLQKEEAKAIKQSSDADDWLKRRDEFYKAATEAAYQRRRDAMLGILLGWIGDAVRQRYGSPNLDFPQAAAGSAAFAEGKESPDLLRRIAAVEDLHRNLQTTVREPLALEVAFIEAFA